DIANGKSQKALDGGKSGRKGKVGSVGPASLRLPCWIAFVNELNSYCTNVRTRYGARQPKAENSHARILAHWRGLYGGVHAALCRPLAWPASVHRAHDPCVFFAEGRLHRNHCQ